MCISSNSNVTFPCKICNTNNIKDINNAAQCNICQFWIHMKCNNQNHIDHKNLEESYYPWFCISYCNEIFSFETLANKKFLSMMMVNSSATVTASNSFTYILQPTRITNIFSNIISHEVISGNITATIFYLLLMYFQRIHAKNPIFTKDIGQNLSKQQTLYLTILIKIGLMSSPIRQTR